jgi:transcriptional regulator with XRE-family HTH domain
MSSTVGQRIFLAHLELAYRLGRKVTLAEFGEMVARAMGRESAFTAAAVSRWENGSKLPSPQVIEAIASLTSVDPGWLSHGERTAAPRPRFLSPTTNAALPVDYQPAVAGRVPEAESTPEDEAVDERVRIAEKQRQRRNRS